MKCIWKWTIISDPHNAFYICKTLGVEPSQTIMVGDTPADTLMGQEVSVYVLSLMKAMFVEQLLLTLRINAHHHFGPKIFF